MPLPGATRSTMAFMVSKSGGQRQVVAEEGQAGAGRLVLVGDQVAAGEGGRDGGHVARWAPVFLNGTWPEIHDDVPM